MNKLSVLIILCLTVSCTATIPEPAADYEGKATRFSSGPMAIVALLFEVDGRAVRLEPSKCAGLLLSRQRVALPAAAAVKLRDVAQCKVRTHLSSVGDRSGVTVYALHLYVNVSPDDADLLEAFAAEARRQAEAVLLAWGQEEIDTLTENLKDVETQLAQTEARIRMLRTDELHRAAEDIKTFSGPEAMKLIDKLKAERLALAMDLEGEEGRRRAISEGITRARGEAEQELTSDPMYAELQKIVAVREEALKTAEELHKLGRLERGEIGTAREKLAEAKINLLRRREELAKAAAGQLLEELTRELTLLEIGTREKQLHLSVIEEQLTTLAEEIKKRAGMDALSKTHSDDLKVLTASYRRLLEEREELKRLLSGGQSVRVLELPADKGSGVQMPSAEKTEE